MAAARIDRDEIGQDCLICCQLRSEGSRPFESALAPRGGGGWPEWGASLSRLLARISQSPTQAVIISQQPLTQRYVQLLIGHGQAHAEASSNVYLTRGSRLTATQEHLLRQIGWNPPTRDGDDPDEMPTNWSLPMARGNWHALTEVLLATIAGVFSFDESEPVHVNSFQIDRPCKSCFPLEAA
jgi:hypothetical protein